MLPQKKGEKSRGRFHYGPPLLGYLTAALLVVGFGILRFTLASPGPIPAPFLLFYPAMAASAFLGGVLPGVAAFAGSALFAHYFYVFPPEQARVSWILLSVAGPLMIAGGARLRSRRERQFARAEELARFRFISDNASEWIFVVNLAGTIEYVNKTGTAQLGFDPEELGGRALAELACQDEKHELEALLKQCSTGRPLLQEICFERKDGKKVWVEVGCTEVQTRANAVIYVSARDVSERRQMDEKLREARRWESLGVLAGGLAHDFNNLLTAVIGNASLARDSLPNPELVSVLLDGVEQAGEGCAELVRLMLATAAYRPRQSEALHMDEILEHLLTTRAVPGRVQVVTETDMAVFHGERLAMETLLWQLIVNACESYGEAGGEVKISVRSGGRPEAEAAQFEEGQTPDGPCLRIAVEDRGCGMEQRVLERAFDPFFTTKFAGRGLGLPAVRGLVRAYSGKLRLKTAPGAGTRVEVWLPENPA